MGASAGMAACGQRILENHGRNQWFKLSSCKLIMQVCQRVGFGVKQFVAKWPSKKMVLPTCRLKWAFLLTNLDDIFRMMGATTAACTWKITPSKFIVTIDKLSNKKLTKESFIQMVVPMVVNYILSFFRAL